jgi:hypothetical protein
VPLKNGQEATIDGKHAAKVGQHNWCLDGKGYVVTAAPLGNGKYRTLLLHRLVMGEPDAEVGHKDHNHTDNRESNLHVTTTAKAAQNAKLSRANKSGRKGVSWHRTAQKWQAKIMFFGKNTHLGYFTDLEAAAQAYKEAVLKHQQEPQHA